MEKNLHFQQVSHLDYMKRVKRKGMGYRESRLQWCGDVKENVRKWVEGAAENGMRGTERRR